MAGIRNASGSAVLCSGSSGLAKCVDKNGRWPNANAWNCCCCPGSKPNDGNQSRETFYIILWTHAIIIYGDHSRVRIKVLCTTILLHYGVIARAHAHVFFGSSPRFVHAFGTSSKAQRKNYYNYFAVIINNRERLFKRPSAMNKRDRVRIIREYYVYTVLYRGEFFHVFFA